MILADYTRRSDAAKLRHEAFVERLAGITLSAVYMPGGITTQTMNEARGAIVKAADAYMTELIDHIDVDVGAMVQNVAETIGLDSPEAMMTAEVTRRYLGAQISAQILRDMSAAEHAIAGARLAGQGAQDGFARPIFSFTDRLGRKTPASHFVDAIWAMSLLSAHNETVLEILIAAGQSLALVIKDEAGLEIIAVRDHPTLRSYAEVREELFHPNSRAYLWSADDVQT